MDTSNPAAFVNAELLHFYVGRRIRALMQVLRSDGGVVIGKSTDEKQLVVKGSPPPAPLTSFVEVVGIVDSDKSIRAEIWTNFGDAIDVAIYNKLCQLAHAEFKHLFLHIGLLLPNTSSRQLGVGTLALIDDGDEKARSKGPKPSLDTAVTVNSATTSIRAHPRNNIRVWIFKKRNDFGASTSILLSNPSGTFASLAVADNNALISRA
ncbi:hypothetical protein RJT34_19607 [Clitoria ternatea]|uniref:Uncharacterized protein n=1 Tax=Clitoria ternatea TaxID=43366 RepID=A0AAN9P4V0_CLITE